MSQQAYGQPPYPPAYQTPPQIPWGTASPAPFVPPPLKYDGKTILGVIFPLIAMILILVSLFLPCWGISIDFPSGSTYKQESLDFGAMGCSISATDSQGNRISTSLGGFAQSIVPQTIAVCGMIFWVTAGILILCIIALVLACLPFMGGRPQPKITAIMLLVGFILAFIPPVIAAVMLPGALTKDLTTLAGGGGSLGSAQFQLSFMGSADSGSGKGTWGPGASWFLMIASMAFLLMAAIIHITTRKTMPMAQPQLMFYPAPQPGVQPSYYGQPSLLPQNPPMEQQPPRHGPPPG